MVAGDVEQLLLMRWKTGAAGRHRGIDAINAMADVAGDWSMRAAAQAWRRQPRPRV